jgi:hypothetical protein
MIFLAFWVMYCCLVTTQTEGNEILRNLFALMQSCLETWFCYKLRMILRPKGKSAGEKGDATKYVASPALNTLKIR